jgi:hypothetical protein
MDIAQKHSNPKGIQETSSHNHALRQLITDVGLREASKKSI